MATIKSAIALYDGVTGPLQSMHKAMNIVINSFETMQDTSGNAVDVTAIQQAREELARAATAFDAIEEEIKQADQAQQKFNDHISAASPAADALGNKLKGILATVASIAGVKSALGWVKENLALADTQRNAENQLKAVLANMGVADVEVPVTTNTTQAMDGLNAYADALAGLNGLQVEDTVVLDDAQALAAVGAFSGAVAGLDGSAYETTLTMDTGAAAGAVADYAAYLEQLDGTTIRTATMLDVADAMSAGNSYLEMVDGLAAAGAVTTVSFDAVDALRDATAYSTFISGIENTEISNSLNLNFQTAATDYETMISGIQGNTLENTLIVNTQTADALRALDAYGSAAAAIDGDQLDNMIVVNMAPAMQALTRYRRAAAGLDGAELENSLTLDTGAAAEAYVELVAAVDGAELENSLALDTTPAMDDLSNAVSGMSAAPVVLDVQANTTQTMSAFDAIAAKASEIQSRGIYGDEAMLAGAAEFATYFSDAEAIMSMMDTLANYAMGMSGGGALDSKAMTDYATNLGKIMTGAYDAMTKKGFQFTDAQKAIIEGTATQAQIVETLGAEYVDMSADMQAAAAINSVIAESWDGLYEAMSNTPEGKIIQLQNRFGDLREALGNQLYGSVLGVADAFDSRWGDIETLMYNLAYAAGALVSVLGTIGGLALDVATFFTENWSWIEPIVWAGVAALTAYAIISGIVATANTIHAISEGVKAAATAMATGATFAETAAQYGLNAALMACPIFWVVAGVIALIAAITAVVRKLDVFGAKGTTVLGTIAGMVNVVIQTFVNLGLLVANIAVGIWNALGAACSNIGTAFHNVIANVQGWFYNLLSTVLTVVAGIAAALNSLPFVTIDYSGIVAAADDYAARSAEAYGSVEEYTSIADAFNEGFNTFDAFNSGWAQDAFDAGAAWGDGVVDTVSDFFGSPFDTSGVDAFDMGNTWDGIYDNVGGIGGSSGDTAANTAAMADQLDYAEEDLKYLRDIAEREAINRFTTAEITVQQENTNYIDRDTDVDGILDAWAADFAEKLDVSME